MISFIVIGKNEGIKLTKCFRSIFDTISFNGITQYELIYIDSNSDDNSVEIVKGYECTRIYQITGICNAAIARNIGANESNGDILFFIDGDMEIEKSFLKIVLNEKKELKYNFVSGNLVDYFYDNKNNLQNKGLHYRYVRNGDKYNVFAGGIFIIKKEIWNIIKGFDERFVAGEEKDFTLRLAKNQVQFLRKKEIIALHHTRNIFERFTIKKLISQKMHFYAKALLYRKNINNIKILKVILREDYTLCYLWISIGQVLLGGKTLMLSLYPIFILLRVILKHSKYRLRDSIIQIYYDISTVLAIILFYPKKVITKQYIKIR